MIPDVFKGELDRLGGFSIEAPLIHAKFPCCEYYSTPYLMATEEARKQGDEHRAAVYHYLAFLVDFHLNNETPQEPHRSRWIHEEGRPFVLADLSEKDVCVLESLSNLTEDAALLARLCDFLAALRKKDHVVRRRAAIQYFNAADRLNTHETFSYAHDYYWRGLILARLQGREGDLLGELSNRFIEATRVSIAHMKGKCCGFMKLLIKFRCGDPNEFVPAAVDAAKEAEGSSPLQARYYWDIAADLFKWAGRSYEEKAARIASAETYVIQAEQNKAEPYGGAMGAAHHLRSGVIALRQAGADPARIEAVRRQLKQNEAESLEQMRESSTGIDVSDIVRGYLEHVRSTTLIETLFKFTLGHPLLDPEQLTREVEESAKKYVAAHLFAPMILDGEGRNVAGLGCLFPSDTDKRRRTVEQHAFLSAHINWELRARAFILPVRQYIADDHQPSLEDLLFVVRHNPFVPPGREEIFLRGLHAGFYGDFLVASHLLVPQIENSLRFVLSNPGVDVSNLLSDGTQSLKTLDTLLSLPATMETFGADVCFELRGLLIEKSGYYFRHQMAHGFLSSAEFHSIPAINVWWLVLRLCLGQVYPHEDTQDHDTGHEKSVSSGDDGEEPCADTVSPEGHPVPRIEEAYEITPPTDNTVMRIYGVDFTSDPKRSKPITFARGQFDGSCLRIDACEGISSFDGFRELLASPGPWVMGIDFPFGLPWEFLTNMGWPESWEDYVDLVEGMSKDTFESLLRGYPEGRDKGRQHPKRHVDRLVNSQSPIKLDFIPVGKMFYRGAPLLANSGACILPFRRNSSDRIILEAYPALVAGKAGFRQKYKDGKSAESQGIRQRICDWLVAGMLEEYNLQVQCDEGFLLHCIDDKKGDTLDSLLCAVQAAWAYSLREQHYGIPVSKEVNIEGWITDPATLRGLGSGHLLFGR